MQVNVFVGLTHVPASASNPVVATASYNIHHKPQISSPQNLPPYGSQSLPPNPQLQHGIRGQLQQQGMCISVEYFKFSLN